MVVNHRKISLFNQAARSIVEHFMEIFRKLKEEGYQGYLDDKPIVQIIDYYSDVRRLLPKLDEYRRVVPERLMKKRIINDRHRFGLDKKKINKRSEQVPFIQ